MPTVNNEGIFSFFFRGGGLVPNVNNEGANQPKSTCAV